MVLSLLSLLYPNTISLPFQEIVLYIKNSCTMCTPCTITRLVRWRVRDWASCFSACSRFSIDDEQDRHRSASTPQLQMRNMGLDTSSDPRSNKAKRKIPTEPKKCSRERQLELGSTREIKDTTTVQPVEKSHIEDPSWPHFAEEDYIVFCFKEDGAFDVVKDGYNKSEASSCIDYRTRSSRPVNRKLHYVEDTRTVERCRNYGDPIMSDQKDNEEEEEIYLDLESPSGGIFEDRRIVSAESSDSTCSDTSTGSFAFPVLGWEWIGSPVQMPKSEGLRLRKHKARCEGFRCCRF